MIKNTHLLTDIRLRLHDHDLRPIYTVDTDQRRLPEQAGRYSDMGKISQDDNLKQAVLIRLLTPRGELSALGHPEYGSRLHELIGRQNTDTIRDLIRLFILESLQFESRIEEVITLTVVPVKGTRDRVKVMLQVQPITKTGIVTIGPFTLELES